MDVLTDDHEREEVVKKWWHENWKPIAAGIVIALAGLIGFKQYQAYQLESSQEKAYEVYNLKNALLLKQDKAIENATAFINENDDLYGSLVALDLANIQIADNKLDEALKNIDFAAKNGGSLVSAIANLMEARINAKLSKFDEAIAILNTINSDAYAIEVNELKGDIYMQMGNRDLAHDAYKVAVDLCKQKDLAISPILQIKFNNVIKSGENPVLLVGQE